MPEQLVRVGRVDLWPRYATEERGGRIVAKDGEKPAVILTTTLSNSPYTCAYQHAGSVFVVTCDGRYLATRDDHSIDLIELSPAPQIEPWEFHEIPVGHWFKSKFNTIAHPCGPVDSFDKTICIGDEWFTASELLTDYEHCPTHCGDFGPCGKVV